MHSRFMLVLVATVLLFVASQPRYVSASCGDELSDTDYIECVVRECHAGTSCNHHDRSFNTSLSISPGMLSSFASNTAWDLLGAGQRQLAYSSPPKCIWGGTTTLCANTMTFVRSVSASAKFESLMFEEDHACTTASAYDAYTESTSSFMWQHRITQATEYSPCDLTRPNVESCVYRLCLDNPPDAPRVECGQKGSVVTWNDAGRWMHHGASASNPNYGSFNVIDSQTCVYPKWSRPSQPSSLLAGIPYVLSVGSATGSEIVQCLPGFRLRNTTTTRDGPVFAACDDDTQNQCVSATSQRETASRPHCNNHGVCALNWTRTNMERNIRNNIRGAGEVNDKWMTCKCTDGYESPDGAAYCSLGPCRDANGVSQPTCSGHGICGASSAAPDAPYACACASGWTGDVCQWPLATQTSVSLPLPTSDRALTFVFQSIANENTQNASAMYSISFPNNSQATIVSSTTNGADQEIRIRDECFVAVGSVPTAEHSLFALSGFDTIALSNTKNEWIKRCLD